MIQVHESVQLSFGAVTIPGLIDFDHKHTFRRILDDDRNPKKATHKSMRDIMDSMEIVDQQM